MDGKLVYDNDKMSKLVDELNCLLNETAGVSFEIWDEIPTIFLRSYYNNEQLISPIQESFEEWEAKLSMRPKPLYSIAFIENEVVSSVYGAGLDYERTLNLWATNPNHQNRKIGKLVLLNFIKHCFQNNPTLPIRAWDITSPQVGNVLGKLGFILK